MATDIPTAIPSTPDAPAPAVAGGERSADAFHRDLPELLQAIPGMWVAYANGQRVRTGPKATPLYQYCLNDLGLPYEAFIVRMVVPEGSDEIEVRPDCDTLPV